MKQTGKQVKLSAPAKINLSLDILGSRDDGYHEVEMVMQSIDLKDKLKLSRQKAGINLKITGAELPEGRNNLAYQAAELILQQIDFSPGVLIEIEKHIPVGGGLAGGSTDAAAVLKGINHLFELNFGYNKLRKMASELGADVAFCLRGGTALARGRGDQLVQLKDITCQNILLINPGFEVSTARIYRKYDQLSPAKKIPTSRLIEKIKTGQEITWLEGWENILEPVTCKIYPEIKQIKKQLSSYQVKFYMMSGSGPTVFAVVESKERGRQIIEDWPRKNDLLFLCQTEKRMKL